MQHESILPRRRRGMRQPRTNRLETHSAPSTPRGLSRSDEWGKPSGYLEAVKRASESIFVDDDEDFPPPIPQDISDDEPLPDIPRLKIPHSAREPSVVPLSVRAELMRQKSEDQQRMMEFRDMMFRLRMTFWQLDNCKNRLIKQYHEMAKAAGKEICPNCKRVLRESIEDHIRELDEEKGIIKYRCRGRSYDDHFMNSSAGRFFPID